MARAHGCARSTVENLGMRSEPVPLKTIADAARDWFGGVSKRTVENLIRDGVLRLTKVGRRSFIAGDDAMRAIERGRRKRNRT
jgi:excisionase family DNA binding protein